MPDGKPAGVPCVQLLPDLGCALFGRPERPAVCSALRPHRRMCGTQRSAALDYLTRLEALTKPHPIAPESSANIRAPKRRK
jgi:uncharacterized protein